VIEMVKNTTFKGKGFKVSPSYKKMEKDEVYIEQSDPCMLSINGKKYRLKKETQKIVDHKVHGNKVIFVPIDEKQVEADIRYIVEKVQDKFDMDEVLTEIIKLMPLEQIEKIKNLLKEKAPVKKTHGCLGLTIGNGSKAEYLQVA
jgi:hypothetical protein